MGDIVADQATIDKADAHTAMLMDSIRRSTATLAEVRGWLQELGACDRELGRMNGDEGAAQMLLECEAVLFAQSQLTCENGHLDHADCDEQCACVGSGKSRLERAEAAVERLKGELRACQETSHQAIVACIEAYQPGATATDLVKAQRQAFLDGSDVTAYGAPRDESEAEMVARVLAEADRRYPEVWRKRDEKERLPTIEEVSGCLSADQVADRVKARKE